MNFDILTLLTQIDWAAVALIVMIDIMLGIDNAVVIAMACSKIPQEHQNKAIAIGTAGAIIARIVLLFVGYLLISIPFVKLIAGAYLLYVAYTMVIGEDGDDNIKQKSTIWGAATTIVIADIVMSLDNVIAVTSASGEGQHSFMYSVFGVLLSIPIILLASKFLIKLIEKFPVIMWIGAAIIAYVGAEMISKEHVVSQLVDHNILTIALTVITMVILFLLSKFKKN